jgi:hypothetical protein
MSWVYIRSDNNELYTVGFYDPEGNFHTDSDFSKEERDAARARVNFLNGDGDQQPKANTFAISNQTHEGRTCQVRVLNREILVVATYTVGGWKAYIGIVQGKNHNKEWQQVLQTGDTLAEDVARFLFPDFTDMSYDR